MKRAYDPEHQITPEIEATHNAINLISAHASRVHKHDYFLSPAPQNQITNNRCNLKSLKYANPSSKIPINTSLAKRNTTQCKQSFHNWNDMYLAKRETQFT